MEEVDATLLVIGSGRPRQVEALRAQAQRMAHPDRVRFLGTVNRLEPYLLASDVFCLPSTHRAEAFGYVLLEAFRLGLPAVTTELGTGTSYVNLEGETGYVVPPENSGALAEGLRKVLSDPGHRRMLGENAKLRVEREFGLDQMVEKILDGYRAALAGPSST
jgi:rhamnosyl/mannosyltransferase